ncbi:MAG: HD domain-containing protein [Nanoarchaeota archaeon]|jgi:uncharacterized protein|nr:HD domain-containing protein [Nanoarchaeota archaeon]
MDIIESLKEEAKYLLEEGEGVHDWDHTLRVYNLAMHIGQIECADLEVLGIAAILHDIGRPTESKLRSCESLIVDRKPLNVDRKPKDPCHAEIGALMAEGILTGYGLGKETIEKIKGCILKHRFSRGHTPETKEEKILYDADKIDNIGAIGILRAANYSGTYNGRTHNPEVHHEDVRAYSREDTAYQHYHIKLKKIKDKLFTAEAKRIAEGRHDFMKDFFDRVNAECRGEI